MYFRPGLSPVVVGVIDRQKKKKIQRERQTDRQNLSVD